MIDKIFVLSFLLPATSLETYIYFYFIEKSKYQVIKDHIWIDELNRIHNILFNNTCFYF